MAQQPISPSIFDIRLQPAAVALASLAIALILTLTNVAQAQTLTVLHNFTGGNDGYGPISGLTVDRAGNLYGTTWSGGPADDGVVFRLSRAGSGWILTPLYAFQGFPDGTQPFGGITVGPDGSLYGTTTFGGQYDYGTVFRLQPSPSACHSVICPWHETILHSFTRGNDGWNPGYGNLLLDRAGNLYGTASEGGVDNGAGVVFELTPSNGGWTDTILWTFHDNAGGLAPQSGLMADSAGNLYGTTSVGGTYGAGTVYELSPSGSGWTERTLASIDFPNNNTCGGVVMDAQGNLFGTSGCQVHGQTGGIFELTPSSGGWIFSTLYSYMPVGYNEGPFDTPTLDAAGHVYGTSSDTGLYNYGEVFTLTPSSQGWTYNSVSFNFNNGDVPTGSVILDSAGNLYGTAEGGGTHNAGVIWEITP